MGVSFFFFCLRPTKTRFLLQRYTFLIGEPPFQTASVKTTYRKIRSNSYSFPDNSPISDSAKDLIRKILVPSPKLRLNLDQILAHSFLADAPHQAPASLFSPVSSLAVSSLAPSPTTTMTATPATAAENPPSSRPAHQPVNSCPPDSQPRTLSSKLQVVSRDALQPIDSNGPRATADRNQATAEAALAALSKRNLAPNSRLMGRAPSASNLPKASSYGTNINSNSSSNNFTSVQDKFQKLGLTASDMKAMPSGTKQKTSIYEDQPKMERDQQPVPILTGKSQENAEKTEFTTASKQQADGSPARPEDEDAEDNHNLTKMHQTLSDIRSGESQASSQSAPVSPQTFEGIVVSIWADFSSKVCFPSFCKG